MQIYRNLSTKIKNLVYSKWEMRYNIIKSKYGVDNMGITNHKRFTTIHRNEDTSGRQVIIKDNETGVLYFRTEGSNMYGVGLTPLLDVDGKPIIDK